MSDRYERKSLQWVNGTARGAHRFEYGDASARDELTFFAFSIDSDGLMYRRQLNVDFFRH